MTDSTTDRGPVTIPAALAWPVVAVLLVFIAGWLYAFAGAELFSPWWLLGSIPVLALLGQALARTQWSDAEYGVGHERGAVWFSRCAALVAGSWLTWSGWATPGEALPLLLLGALPLWGWFAILSVRAPKAAERTAERYEEGRQVVQERGYRTLLDRAGCDDVLLTAVREHRAGVELTVEPDPGAQRTPTYDTFAGRGAGLATQAAMHYRQMGKRLPRNAVRTEPGADDAEFRIHITTTDVFAEATTYVPDYVPGDIVNALDLGEYEDAGRLLVSITGHMKIVGATGAGKSNLANNIIGRITGCANALVWVAATDKLVPLVWPWLRPFFEGRTDCPLLDYVAGQDVHSVLRLLRAAYKLACERNARLDDESRLRATSDEPAVFVFVEEVSHGVEFTDWILTHDGQEATVSDLLKMIAQGGRSANVWLILMSQYGINAALGDRASELIRNLTMRICLRTMKSYDGSETLPGLPAGIDTTALTNFTMYVQPNTDEPRAFPAKAPKLEGAELVEPVAIANTRWRPAGVEEESELGEDYDGRWDEERIPILARRVRKRGWAWPVGGVDVLPEPGPEFVPEVVDTPSPGPRDDGPQRPAAGGPNDGEGTVGTKAWTDEDDAALRAFLGDEPAGPVGPSTSEVRSADRTDGGPRSQPFGLPDLSADLARLDALWPEDGPAGPVEEPGPGRSVPDPLDRVIAWLDSQPDRGPDGWVRSEELAEGIGWTGPSGSFGRAMFPLVGRTANLPRTADPQQRRGYPVRLLREVADRHRFGDERGPA